LPTATEGVAGVTAIDSKVGAVPDPLRVTNCGLDSPLSVIVRVPDRVPRTFGVKVTETVQLPVAASVAGLTGQLLVSV
jgi:hypothetical protein